MAVLETAALPQLGHAMIVMARTGGFEPPTSCFQGTRATSAPRPDDRWSPRRELHPCRRDENPTSLLLDDEAMVARAGAAPAPGG